MFRHFPAWFTPRARSVPLHLYLPLLARKEENPPGREARERGSSEEARRTDRRKSERLATLQRETERGENCGCSGIRVVLLHLLGPLQSASITYSQLWVPEIDVRHVFLPLWPSLWGSDVKKDYVSDCHTVCLMVTSSIQPQLYNPCKSVILQWGPTGLSPEI